MTAATATVLAAASLIFAPGWVRAAPSARGGSECRSGYRYAGYASRDGVDGIAATVSAARKPLVASGHAAAWIGVGNRRLWLQVGIAAFPRIGLRRYVETAAPAKKRTFVDLGPATPGRRYRMVVVEVAPDLWQASIDGRRVGPLVSLPAPRGSWRGIATTETWSAGRARCNSYAYRFDGISVTAGGRWTTLSNAERIGRRVDGRSATFSAIA